MLIFIYKLHGDMPTLSSSHTNVDLVLYLMTVHCRVSRLWQNEMSFLRLSMNNGDAWLTSC